jgi:hypothetical protein
MSAKERLVSFSTALVPSFQGVGFTLFDLVNFALHGDNPIGQERCLVKEEGFPKAFPRAARGHNPSDLVLFSRASKPSKEFGSQRLLQVFAG